MKFNKNTFFCLFSILLIGLAAGCSKTQSSVTPVKPVAKSNIQLVVNSKLGTIITDSAGISLYFFAFDATLNSKCNGGCAVAWEPYYNAKPVLPKGLSISDFSVITRSDGSLQTSYKGWPLYRYFKDTIAGSVIGDNSGGTWFIAKPNYSVMVAKAQLIGLDGIDYLSTDSVGTGLTLYMTDAFGHTLYSYSGDTKNANTYTTALSNNTLWPIYQSSVKNIPSILDSTQFSTISINGETQLTYKGRPLYYFGPDNDEKGSTKGVSVTTPARWTILNTNTEAAQ